MWTNETENARQVNNDNNQGTPIHPIDQFQGPEGLGKGWVIIGAPEVDGEMSNNSGQGTMMAAAILSAIEADNITIQ